MVTSQAVAVTETPKASWMSGRATAIIVELSGASVVPTATVSRSQRVRDASDRADSISRAGGDALAGWTRLSVVTQLR